MRVVIADREAGTRDMFYVADLTKKKDDGSYDTRAVRRREWEDEIEKRRDAYLTKLAPPPKANPSGTAHADAPPPPDDKRGFTVVIYGAAWCGPCHQAEAHLKKKGVAHVMKDIESTPGANAEMQAKLKQSGRRGGSIPVIDVRGQWTARWPRRRAARSSEPRHRAPRFPQRRRSAKPRPASEARHGTKRTSMKFAGPGTSGPGGWASSRAARSAPKAAVLAQRPCSGRAHGHGERGARRACRQFHRTAYQRVNRPACSRARSTNNSPWGS